MEAVLSSPDLPSLLKRADRAAGRICRKHNLPWFDTEDARQELLLDLLGRLQHHDTNRGPLWNFTAICFSHRGYRLDLILRRDQRHRAKLSLDDTLPGTEHLTLADTLADEDGLGPWVGQDTNPIDHAMQRHDLDRALSGLPANIVPLCVSLLQPGSAGDATLPRTTRHRRVRELRCQLLTAGIGGTSRRVRE